MTWRGANILDPIHETLDPRVFDDPASTEPRVKQLHVAWIVGAVHKALSDHGYTDITDWLHLVLTGSLTTYQYSDASDFDVSLFVDVERFPEWSRGEMIGVMVGNVDGQVLPGTPHPVQAFVVPPGITPQTLYRPGLRSGYDLNDEHWIVPPERDRVFDVKAQMRDAYMKAVESADKMARLLKYDPPRAVMYWHQIHKRRREDQMRGLGDFTESNIIYKELANRGLFPEISDASGEYIARAAALGDKPEDWGSWDQDEPKGPWNHPPDQWSDEDWLKWKRDQVRPELAQPDPNCKWCYGQGWFVDPKGGPDIPCGKCMHGRTTPAADLRHVYRQTSEEPGVEWGEKPDYSAPTEPCPYCNSSITGERVVGEPPNQWVQNVCGSCHSTWQPKQQDTFEHPDPWMDNEPGSLTLPEHWSKGWDPREWRRQQHEDPNLVTTPARLVGMPWVPGYHGKALQDPEGNLHTWNVEDRGGPPHHRDMAGEFGGQYYNPLRIMPDGTIDPARPITEQEYHPDLYPKIFEDEPRIKYAPPILFGKAPADSDWVVGAKTSNWWTPEMWPHVEPHVQEHGDDAQTRYMEQAALILRHADELAARGAPGAFQVLIAEMRGLPDNLQVALERQWLDAHPEHDYGTKEYNERVDLADEAKKFLGRTEQKTALGDPRQTIVRKWVYNGDTGELAVGEEAPEEGSALSHAQLADQLGVTPDTAWVGGTISRTGWVSIEVGRDRNKVRADAHQAIRRAVPEIEGFVGGEAKPISDPEPVQLGDWAL